MTTNARQSPSLFVQAFWLVQRLSPFKSLFFRLFYNNLMRKLPADDVTFLNYGFKDEETSAPELQGGHNEDGSSLQRSLYERVIRDVDVEGKVVLEVGCGRGGGAAHIAKNKGAKWVEGVDLSTKQIDFCISRHNLENLGFRCANAVSLPYAEEKFDVVFSVEASHCYPNVVQFYKEVFRVLRPGGFFLYADFNPHGSPDIPENPLKNLKTSLESAGFSIASGEDITEGVLAALDESDDEKRKLIEHSSSSKFAKKNLKDFAALKDSTVYHKFFSGESTYFLFVAQKKSHH